MIFQISIISTRQFSFKAFTDLLGLNDCILAITPNEVKGTWAFYRKEHATTLFLLEQEKEKYALSMDRLATYDDYQLWPYLVDTLSMLLTDKAFRINELSAFDYFNEDWMADAIGDEIAYLKCMLSLHMKYYLSLPIPETNIYVNQQALERMGVSIHSATPRIYGYIGYMLKHNLLPAEDVVEKVNLSNDCEVNVPQHESIGKVLSWQTDGAETTESYCKEDVELLLHIAQNYDMVKGYEGVVLNDIGTIYEHGIGVEQNVKTAVYWYNEALKNGDSLYASTNLGDIFRCGRGNVPQNLERAIYFYKQSTDPYAWFRLGQSYEEGWTTPPNLEQAMCYYNKAAQAGHHLALKKLKKEVSLHSKAKV